MVNKVLVVGPGKSTRGGITEVISSYSKTSLWSKWGCIWIETYVDKNTFFKLFYFFKGFMIFLYHLFGTSLVHIHFSEPTSALRKSFFFFVARLFGKKIILHLHAFSVNSTIEGSKSKLYLKMFSHSEKIIVLSEFWRKRISEFTGEPEKIEVVYNPCPSIKENSTIHKAKQILFAGTLNKRKGYNDLIRAFAQIKEHNGWTIVFAGNGEIDEGKELAKTLGVTEKVVFKGWVSGEEKDCLFRNSSIFCLPSYAEGFPMAVLDAWAYSLPIITTPVGGIPDIVEHKINGLIFSPGHVEELASCLKELMNDQNLYMRIKNASWHLSKSTFNLDNIEKQIDSLYERIIVKN